MAARTDKTITVEFFPKQDGKELRLDDFLEEMEAFRVALRETERLASDKDPSLFFTIKRLQKNSPAIIELEAESEEEQVRRNPQFAGFVIHSLTANLSIIGTKRVRPRRIDVPTLNAYEGLTKPLERHGIEITVKSGHQSVTIGREFRDAIKSVMGEDEVSYGSLSGRIEAMTTHSRNSFRLYPLVGARRVSGYFRAKDKATFTAAMDKYVTVWGKLKYKTWDKFPYAIWAEDVEIHDPTLAPSLLEFRGVAPNATGDLSTIDFLDYLRDE